MSSGDALPSQSTAPEWSQNEFDEFANTRADLLKNGFTGCNVKLPTKTWHGVIVEAFVDLDIYPSRRVQDQDPGLNMLFITTLSGIAYDVQLGTPEMQIVDRVNLDADVDVETKDRMKRIAYLGRHLAYEGLGFPEEYPWIQPIEPVEGPVVLCADNPTRRYKVAVVKQFSEVRQADVSMSQ